MKTNRWLSTTLLCVRITMLFSLVFNQFAMAVQPASSEKAAPAPRTINPVSSLLPAVSPPPPTSQPNENGHSPYPTSPPSVNNHQTSRMPELPAISYYPNRPGSRPENIPAPIATPFAPKVTQAGTKMVRAVGAKGLLPRDAPLG